MYDVSVRGVDERMIYVIIIIIIIVVVVVRLYSAHTAASVCDFLTCAEMLMHAIAHMGCANTVRESALKGDSRGEKKICRTGGVEPYGTVLKSYIFVTAQHFILRTFSQRFKQ